MLNFIKKLFRNKNPKFRTSRIIPDSLVPELDYRPLMAKKLKPNKKTIEQNQEFAFKLEAFELEKLANKENLINLCRKQLRKISSISDAEKRIYLKLIQQSNLKNLLDFYTQLKIVRAKETEFITKILN